MTTALLTPFTSIRPRDRLPVQRPVLRDRSRYQSTKALRYAAVGSKVIGNHAWSAKDRPVGAVRSPCGDRDFGAARPAGVLPTGRATFSCCSAERRRSSYSSLSRRSCVVEGLSPNILVQALTDLPHLEDTRQIRLLSRSCDLVKSLEFSRSFTPCHLRALKRWRIPANAKENGLVDTSRLHFQSKSQEVRVC